MDANSDNHLAKQLYNASCNGLDKEVLELLQKGAPPNNSDYCYNREHDGATSLHMACAHNHLRIKFGASTDNDCWTTPLHWECANNRKATTKLLLEHHCPTEEMSNYLKPIDLMKLYLAVFDARNQWRNILLMLEVSSDTIDSIGTKWRNNPVDCYCEDLLEWLNSRKGSRRDIVKALSSPTVGHSDLASTIERDHVPQPTVDQNSQKINELFVHKRLDKGVFGAIFKVSYRGDPCAIEVLLHDAMEASKVFARDCKVLELLQHPNIVQHLSTAKHPKSGSTTLAVELMDNLRSYLSGLDEESLTRECEISLSKDVSCGLAYIHSKQIIHRDLCVLLKLTQPVPVAKISDFGMSRLYKSSKLSHTLTAVGHRMGYLPPEAIQVEEEKCDNSLDIFSLGVIMQIVCHEKLETIKSTKDRSFHVAQIPHTHRLRKVIDSCLQEDMIRRPYARDTFMEPPLIRKYLPLVWKMKVGQSVSLTAQARGGTGLTYLWTKDDAPLRDEDYDCRGVFTSSLTMRQASLEQSGEYQCVMENEGGCEWSSTCKVTVDRPKNMDTPVANFAVELTTEFRSKETVNFRSLTKLQPTNKKFIEGFQMLLINKLADSRISANSKIVHASTGSTERNQHCVHGNIVNKQDQLLISTVNSNYAMLEPSDFKLNQCEVVLKENIERMQITPMQTIQHVQCKCISVQQLEKDSDHDTVTANTGQLCSPTSLEQIEKESDHDTATGDIIQLCSLLPHGYFRATSICQDQIRIPIQNADESALHTSLLYKLKMTISVMKGRLCCGQFATQPPALLFLFGHSVVSITHQERREMKKNHNKASFSKTVETIICEQAAINLEEHSDDHCDSVTVYKLVARLQTLRPAKSLFLMPDCIPSQQVDSVVLEGIIRQIAFIRRTNEGASHNALLIGEHGMPCGMAKKDSKSHTELSHRRLHLTTSIPPFSVSKGIYFYLPLNSLSEVVDNNILSQNNLNFIKPFSLNNYKVCITVSLKLTNIHEISKSVLSRQVSANLSIYHHPLPVQIELMTKDTGKLSLFQNLKSLFGPEGVLLEKLKILIINIAVTSKNSLLLMENYKVIIVNPFPDLCVSHLESKSCVTEAKNKEHRTKSKKKIAGFVPPRRQLFLLLKCRRKRKIRGKQSALKARPLSDSEDDKNLPDVVQEKSFKTLKSRMQKVTISRYTDPPKLKGHVSAKLAYFESDSNSQEEDIGNQTDIFASDQCSSVKMDLVHNSQYSYSKEPVAQTMQALLSKKGTAIFRVGAPSTELEFKRLRVSVNVQAFYLLIKREKSAIVTYISTENKQELYCFENRGLGRKKKPVYRVTSEAETLYDFSKSAIVHGSFSKRNLVVIKELETPKSNFVGIPSHEKLSQSNIGLVDHISTSETSSQQLYSSATYERTDSMRLPTLAAANSLSTSSPPVAAESPVKSKGVRGRVQVDGEQKASLNASIPRASTIRTSERTRERNSPRENDSSLQRSIPTRRSPDWIAIATKLLHVPDYQKMIQILNGVTPAQEDVVAHKFIKGIAYFKVGKLRQAMDDLHKCEKFALESIEDERRAHSQRQLDSGVFSMQPGSQASPQASSLQYLQQSSKKGDVAVCNVYMGDLHYTSGSYLEASKCYQRAADLYDRECVARLFRMVPPTISTIHSKCGSCLRNLSKSMEAIQEYRNAIETAIRDKDRLAAHTSLGNLQQTLGQNKEALVEYEHALDLAETLNEHMSVGWTHGNIGNAFLGLNEKDKALFHLQKALDITIKYEPKPDSIGRAYNNLGTAYQSMGDLDKAEEHYDLALSQAIYGNDPAGQSRVYGNIGNIYIVRKRFEKAIPHYTEVLRLSKDEATISTAHHNRGCALYEWAESKMLALEQSLQKTSSSNEPTFRFHGSQTTLSKKHSPRIVIDSIAKLFRDGMSDLQKVAETHEAKLDHIKGSAKGLSLSVSLTESNSRTFHRLQDCMVAIGNWREALLIAEQSRARTLGEIMLARKESQLEKALTSPLNLEHVYSIVSSQKSPVLYLTHTGASLFGWVLVPAEDSDSISIEMFEIPISDDQFNGKSFDYHIRYGLTEVLVEQSYEMYRSIDYDKETTAPVAQLFKVIGKPFQMTLDRLLPGNKKAKMQKIVLITDTYTSLLPFTCMYDPDSETFLGDHYYFKTMQSLLTMGIMNQLPEPMVELPADPQSMCIVGNPIIPKFYLNGEVWSLGKLPYARREAQWVGHILNTPPILDEQATKSAVVMRFMRAKVIHIATHGSSVSGFLAFASLTSTRQGEGVDSSGVLLHPEEVEKLSISPALVVLSSCDSSRGTVKADGVQGMARAFLLAGAQAVLTALWRVPDESAAVFMRFFYRFLENGFESSLSLQKAILSLRCFSKYSQYIHWSGYQLTGRSIRLDMKPSLVTTILESTLRPSSPFPRLMLVKKLESVLVENPRLPTDIQILHGSPGVKPSEIAIDFIHSCHAKFAAGIFWISCRTPDIIDASLKSIEKTIDKPLNKLRLSDTQQALMVLDNTIELPSSGKLISFLKHTNVHIIILSKSADPLDSFVKEVDKALIRGCSIHEVKTLSTIDSTQRIVYEISKQYYLKANNNDQAIFEKLAEFTSGSPLIVDIAAQVLLKFVQENSDKPSEGLNQFADSIQLSKSRKVVHKSPLANSLQGVEDTCFQVREISDALTHLVPNVASVSPNHTDVWESESEYDSWDSIGALIQRCVSTPGEMLLLQALSIFGCIPIPIPLVTTMSSLIAQSSGHSHLAGILHERLMEAKLILRYPQPVVLHSTYTKGDNTSEEPLFLYLPQHLASQLWLCNDIDQVMAVTVAYKALQKVIDENSPKSPELLHFYLGLIPPLEEKTALLAVEKKHCYEAVYELYLQLSHQLSSNNHTHI